MGGIVGTSVSGLYFSNQGAEFKKFEPKLKFKSRLKYGWFHLKSCSLF